MKNNKSIWLRKLGISMLNQPDSTLSIAYRYLSRLVGGEQALLYLKETSSDEPFSILLLNGTASVYSLSDENNSAYSKIIEQILISEIHGSMDDFYIIPLSSYKASRFGFIVFKAKGVEWNETIEQAADSFGELIYSELMGGFLISDHKTVMEVKDVALKYDDSSDKNVVDHISLKINEGELTIIMGKSGCGKSSLLNIMASLLSPNSGAVLYKGKDVCTMKEKEKNIFRKDELGYIFQNYNLIKELTAEENVSIAALLSKKSSTVDEALKLVGLQDYGNYYPRQMSGGMQQRVAIARALVKNASILLCDEPTGALDSENGKLVMGILQDIAHQQNIPVVVVSHNTDYAVLADHYILLKDGQIEEEYYNHFAHNAREIL